jgi:hypothetical protein
MRVRRVGEQTAKALRCLRWIPGFAWQRVVRRHVASEPAHLIIALADHFEPSIVPEQSSLFASADEQERRLERWCRTYPRIVDAFRDADGFPFRHTYFYPAEQYDKALIDRLAEHCQAGWGELGIHLHHGLSAPDTPEGLRRILCEFRDALDARGCLPRWEDEPRARYAFVHGNWALANSGGGRACGVDEEMQILSDTGCYADLTLPSAPNRAQVGKINALYECARPLTTRAPHRRGHDLRCGRAPTTFPLIIQGPLALDLGQGLRRPRIENAALTGANPPTMRRLGLWTRAAIGVAGRPDWLFIKLHCHGMDPRDEDAMLGTSRRLFLRQVTAEPRVHFVTAREMVNIILAACDGRDGNPGAYRDYRLRLSTPAR